MRSFALSIVGLFLLAVVAFGADQDKTDLSGTWKVDPSRVEPTQGASQLMLVVEDKGSAIHIRETRGPNLKEDVSDFTCGTMGKECSMVDGGEKAAVSVYYNGPALVVLKTHGRRGSSVEKKRLSMSPAGDSLIVEITPIVPKGKTERLVLSKGH